MGTLRLLDEPSPAERHDGEVYSCAFTPEGAFVLSGGWDGQLRLWDAGSGRLITTLPASPKPLSACACSPDGKYWLSGSMEGLFSVWDSVSHQSLLTFVAHTRPISCIAFAPDGQTFATTSWDRHVVLRKLGREREGRTLAGHHDIVAGCRFSQDGRHLFSWSHDRTIKQWEVSTGREGAMLAGHGDRVVAFALSPDGRWAVSGSRDATVRLWDLTQPGEVATVTLGAEVRDCFFLLDAESIVVADGADRLFLMSVPGFEVQAQVQAPFKPLCGALAPSGLQLALGGEDGRVHLAWLDGFEEASLVVNATQNVRQKSTFLGRMFGTTRTTNVYSYACPACRNPLESPTLPAEPVACPRCRRWLRVNQPQALSPAK